MKTPLILLTAIALCAADTNDPFFLNGNYVTAEDAPLLSIDNTYNTGPFLSLGTNSINFPFTVKDGIEAASTDQYITWNDWHEPTSVSVRSTSVTNVTWHFDAGTNIAQMSTSLRNVTNWLTIDRHTNANQIVSRQIGQVQTNRVLSLIYQDRTNHLIIGTEGKEQWPNQRRTNSEPVQPARRTK